MINKLGIQFFVVFYITENRVAYCHYTGESWLMFKHSITVWQQLVWS